MLDSLVRVSRRVLRVPETESSQTDTRTVRDSTAATTDAPHPLPHSGRRRDTTLSCVGPDARERVRVSHQLPSDGRSVTPHGLHNTKEAKTPGGHLHRHRTGRDVLLREKCTPSPERYVRDTCPPTEIGDIESTPVRRGMTMNLSVRSFEFRRFTPGRFHVLLNSLFKVLFNFPSRYLFAIGLAVIFSLRWSLPPT